MKTIKIKIKIRKWEDNQYRAYLPIDRSSRPKAFLRKIALKICSKFKGESPCRSAICTILTVRFLKAMKVYGTHPLHRKRLLTSSLLKSHEIFY